MLISGMLKQDAIQIFLAGVEAVKPHHFVPRHLHTEKNTVHISGQSFSAHNIQNLYIAAVGKAASAMAMETEKILGSLVREGLVVTKYDHGLPLRVCRIIEAGHPVPDQNSLSGGKEIIALFKKAGKDDIILLLVSGGASALTEAIPNDCTLNDFRETAQLLLDCGAAIGEINTVRKHLSLIKGGQLMQYTKARVIALILSDVPGDDLSVIASGLTVPDSTTFKDAWQIIEKYELAEKLPLAVKNRLWNGVKGTIPDTPKTGDSIFSRVHNSLVATNRMALDAASQKAQALGYNVKIIDSMLTGEAATQAGYFVQRLKDEYRHLPVCLLWGGEPTVTITGKGRGGRNQHFALAALSALQNDPWTCKNRFVILSGGTDGTDGPTNAAGAVADGETLSKAEALSLSPKDYLYQNDAYHFFEKTGGLIVTGATQTNVMDIVAGLVGNP